MDDDFIIVLPKFFEYRLTGNLGQLKIPNHYLTGCLGFIDCYIKKEKDRAMITNTKMENTSSTCSGLFRSLCQARFVPPFNYRLCLEFAPFQDHDLLRSLECAILDACLPLMDFFIESARKSANASD